MEENVYLGTSSTGVSVACKKCFNLFKVGRLKRGPACARCKTRNTCRPCMIKVMLNTLGEKEGKIVCEDCFQSYKEICELVKQRNNWD